MLPHIPDHAPFSAEQRSWLNGFFAGLFSVQDLDVADTPVGSSVTVLFGSQTGTAEGLARKTSRRLAEAGFAPTVRPLDDCAMDELAEAERLLVITSTYGDGEMPDNAQVFWEELSAADAPSLATLAYAVLALGDSSYPDFCQAGKDIDARLAELGARCFHDRVDCDVDVDEPFEAWLKAAVASIPADRPLARAA